MTSRHLPDVSLTPELDAFVAERVRSGDHADAREVVLAALQAMRAQAAPAKPAPAPGTWPVAGGECGGLIRSRDWSRTPLGAVELWSLELRATVANIVNSPVAKVLMWGPSHVMIYNDAYSEIAGANHPRALGGTVPDIWPEIWDWNRTMLEAGFRGEQQSFRDQPLTLKRGGRAETLVFDLFYTPVYEAGGGVGGVMCTVVDNSAKVEAERRLVASEAELRRIADSVPMLIAYIGQDHRYRFANAAYEDWFGVSPAEMVGRHVRDVVGAEAYEERRPWIERALAGERMSCEAALRRREGGRRRSEIRYIPRIEEDGSVDGVHIIAIDIEERARRVDEAAASHRRFRTAMDAVHGILWTNDASGRMTGEQPGWAALTGQSFEDYQDYGWAAAVHPDDAAGTVAGWQAALADKRMFVHEHRVRRADGAWRAFAIRALPILDAQGEIVEWVGVHTDITHQRAAEHALRGHAEALSRQVAHRERAEEQLRQVNESLEARVVDEIDERRRAEARLLQAQKMETIGKLTGGVAHDFNNLLQVVSGNLQLLAKDIAGNERAERRVSNAMAGVSRGAKLAAQLLAFGRRQALEPKVVNVSRLVAGMDDMLRRAIGEAIEVETIFSGGLWNTFIDPAQIENALLNLAINARDAMGGRGKLTIELANAALDDDYARTHDEVTAGQYVMLAVTDTGCGIAPEIADKVFEPFFSTKAEGKGSGLGLSMVYGFVKQSGGHVKIYSEAGHGATIRLYLPRAFEAEDVEVDVTAGPLAGGTETVLVVEDDDEVRDTVVAMVGDLGYRVLKAVDAQSALSVIESGVPIDLLFTDVVMPGALKSPELARKARERLPNVAVLFTSGYTENSIVHGGKLDAGVELLSKPYTREALARKFRHVLGNNRQRMAAAQATGPAPTQRPVEAAAIEPPEAVTARPTVLLVEDDALIRVSTADMLQLGGYLVVEAASAEDAMAALKTAPVDVLVTDLNLPGASGAALAVEARALHPAIAIVYATGDSCAVRLDAGVGVLTKPYDSSALIEAVEGVRGGRAAPEGEADVALQETLAS